MKLKKIHRILKFKQSDWMRPYIDFNTKKTIPNSEADKNFFKLMNNSVYGKTMENLRKRIKIRVVKNSQDFIKYTSKPTCVNWKVFENNLAAIHEKKISSNLNKLIGFTVSELSKWECIIFTITLWLESLIPDYYLLTQIVYVMKYMEKTHTKKYTSTKNYLI